VRADDLFAESLEAIAKGLPPRKKVEADIWLDMAKTLRASKNEKMIRVREFEVDAKDDL
jgi:hypothetical protein